MEAISKKKPTESNGIEVYRYSKAVFGIQDAPTGGGYGGEEFGLSIVNVLWPRPEFIHRNEYTIGPTVSAKLSVEIKIDFGSEVEWGISGLHIETTIGEENQYNNHEFKLDTFLMKGWFAALWGVNVFMSAFANKVGSSVYLTKYRGFTNNIIAGELDQVLVKLDTHFLENS